VRKFLPIFNPDNNHSQFSGGTMTKTMTKTKKQNRKKDDKITGDSNLDHLAKSTNLQQKRKDKMSRALVSFDWAIKRILRSKVNFPVIEGLLTVILQEEVKIIEIIESESNKSRDKDKFNRVDLAIKDSKGKIIIVEIQSVKDKYFMKRLAYGTSKVITERMGRGDQYEKVAKVISIAILFYTAGKDGADCIYGSNEFIDFRTGEKINLTQEQQEYYNVKSLTEVFPEYYLLVVENFNSVAKNNLDQWLYFFKNEKIEDNFTAPGLKEAKEILDICKLSDDEYKEYQLYQYNNGRLAGEREAAFDEGEKKGEKKREVEIAIEMINDGVAIKTIAKYTGLSITRIEELQNR